MISQQDNFLQTPPQTNANIFDQIGSKNIGQCSTSSTKETETLTNDNSKVLSATATPALTENQDNNLIVKETVEVAEYNGKKKSG